MSVKLGVNLDHVATVRQARGTLYPDIVAAAHAALAGGADGITVHLREDRRHIQDGDVLALRPLSVPLNLEMAATEAMMGFALQIKPDYCCLVPEQREELTTEGGLNVVDNHDYLKGFSQQLTEADIQVSLFIDPDMAAIDAAVKIGAPIVELHTGEYADARTLEERDIQLHRIIAAAAYARERGLIVNAGHGLTIDNVAAIAAIKGINELNIGHSIIAMALMVGMEQAVSAMKAMMLRQ